MADQHNKRVGIGFSKTPHPLDFGWFPQAEFAFHPASWWNLAIPVNSLHMLVHSNRQTMSSFEASVFQDFSPARSLHPRTKTMDSYSSSDFGLICSLGWHNSIFLSLWYCYSAIFRRDIRIYIFQSLKRLHCWLFLSPGDYTVLIFIGQTRFERNWGDCLTCFWRCNSW